MAIRVDVDFSKPQKAKLSTLGVGAPFVTAESYQAETPAIAMAIGLPDANGDVPCLVTNSGQNSWLPFSLPGDELVFLVENLRISAALSYN